MQVIHSLKAKRNMNDIRARYNGQVSTTTPQTLHPNNPSTGNRTFLLPRTPTFTIPYHSWISTIEIDPTPRTFGGFVWYIPGDNGEGYESPVTPSDSASLSGLSDPRWSPPRSSPAPSSVSIPFNRNTSTIADEDQCACCGIRHALSHFYFHIRDAFFTRTQRFPIQHLPNPRLAIDAALLQIHLNTSSTTFARFMIWFFNAFEICRYGERVHFPERHHLKLPAKAVALLVAMDLEERVLCVKGDGEDREIAWSCAVELRKLTRWMGNLNTGPG